MKITRRVMLTFTASLLFGLVTSFFPQNNLPFAQEKPRMPRSDIYKKTNDTIDELAEIAKKHGLEVSDEQKKALFDRFLEANYEALSKHYALYDDP